MRVLRRILTAVPTLALAALLAAFGAQRARPFAEARTAQAPRVLAASDGCAACLLPAKAESDGARHASSDADVPACALRVRLVPAQDTQSLERPRRAGSATPSAHLARGPPA